MHGIIYVAGYHGTAHPASAIGRKISHHRESESKTINQHGAGPATSLADLESVHVLGLGRRQ